MSKSENRLCILTAGVVLKPVLKKQSKFVKPGNPQGVAEVEMQVESSFTSCKQVNTVIPGALCQFYDAKTDSCKFPNPVE